jgi:hypothetical protein
MTVAPSLNTTDFLCFLSGMGGRTACTSVSRQSSSIQPVAANKHESGGGGNACAEMWGMKVGIEGYQAAVGLTHCVRHDCDWLWM